MNKMNATRRLLIGLLIWPIFQPAASAQSLEIWSRNYTFSCGYYSNSQADFSLSFLPTAPIADAELLVGFGGTEVQNQGESVKFDWRDTQWLKPVRIDDHGYSFEFNKVIGQRSSPIRISSLQFVLKVIDLDGRVDWLRGNPSPLGFYQSKWSTSTVTNCVSPGRPLPEFQPLEIESIERF